MSLRPVKDTTPQDTGTAARACTADQRKRVRRTLSTARRCRRLPASSLPKHISIRLSRITSRLEKKKAQNRHDEEFVRSRTAARSPLPAAASCSDLIRRIVHYSLPTGMPSGLQSVRCCLNSGLFTCMASCAASDSLMPDAHAKDGEQPEDSRNGKATAGVRDFSENFYQSRQSAGREIRESMR